MTIQPMHREKCTVPRRRSVGVNRGGQHSPNITLGINFLILAAKLFSSIAPFADVAIIEQHFRDKPEVSGTARKIAESLAIGADQITSLRLGGIVGHHEVIFSFPYQRALSCGASSSLTAPP